MRIAPLVFVLVSSIATMARAQEQTITPPPQAVERESPGDRKQYPALGGHLGFAVPILTLKKDSTVIGKDFVQLGVTPGVTIHLDEHWAIDLEFIAFNEVKNTPSNTTLIVDPGVVRKFESFKVGLRVATRVGVPSNIGLVPIFVVPFRISESLVYFVEADLPLFLNEVGNKVHGSATFQVQSGFGF
jgi:hypothetical protein